MTISQVITTLPTAPDPSTMTRDQFSTAAAASVLAQKAMVPELNTWTSQVNAIVSGTAGDIASGINGASAKTTPVDADLMTLTDSAASWVLKKLTWANLKATLGSTFAALAGSASQNFAVNNLTVAGAITETGVAWTAYTPAVTLITGVAGTITISTARYRLLGKTLFVNYWISVVVTSGTPTAVRVPLPASLTFTSYQMSPAVVTSAGVAVAGQAQMFSGMGYIDFIKLDGTAFAGTAYVQVNLVAEVN